MQTVFDSGGEVLGHCSIQSSSLRRRLMPADPCELFLQFSRQKLVEQYWPRLRKAVETLSDEQIWWRPNDASNSIGNLILHLNGNVWQWMVASFNRLEDRRGGAGGVNAPGRFLGAVLFSGVF